MDKHHLLSTRTTAPTDGSDFKSDNVTKNHHAILIERALASALARPGLLLETHFQPIYQRADRLGVDLSDCPSFFAATQRLLAQHHQHGAGLAPRSLEQFHSAVRVFTQWCHVNRRTALPASADTFVLFARSNAPHITLSTLHIYVWAIRKLHLITGLVDPTNSQAVKQHLSRIKKQKIAQFDTAQDQAVPLSDEDYRTAMTLLMADDHPISWRDATLLGLAYHTMLRQSELVRIQLTHIQPRSDGDWTLEIPYTKTNKTGRSEYVTLPHYLMPILQRYLSLCGDRTLTDPGYLFVPLTRSGVPRRQRMHVTSTPTPRAPSGVTPRRKTRGGIQFAPVAPDAVTGSITAPPEPAPISEEVQPVAPKLVARTLKKVGERLAAHTSSPQADHAYSGHSARVGRAIHLLEIGARKEDIVKAGRWKSDVMFERYTRQYDVNDGYLAQIRKTEDRLWRAQTEPPDSAG
ncbi:tyrosine-type recombinase/integrase [Vibrio nigripulchritudo]|uniref:tyrosine-type recombinase/integrase n=1 Tax=Vibrio nigripulchritudo TaxID=28173 RepID=UPI0024917E48|nr:tyrosine-type recombinase/integrase [Vibrio nigripulchritudo]BDU41165.1 hypothetical protein TUMSATVNIG2_56340 [Vibrio nigripulchritudo]BDU46930.1 hypothetical protein TUMSATVNIG3_57280 [Vibrio nigripulchritudo]